MKKIAGITFSLLFSCVLGLQAQGLPQQEAAPTDFTDEEYEEFVNVNKAMVPVQQEVEEKMIASIQDKGLTMERFNELAQAQQNGNITDASEDAQEIAQFNEAGQEVMSFQQELGTEMQKKIAESSIPLERFQQIMMAYNQHANIREKIDALMGDIEE